MTTDQLIARDAVIGQAYADCDLFEMAPGWTRADHGFYAYR